MQFTATNILLIDNLCGTVVEYMKLNEYHQVFPLLSKYHHLFLYKNKYLLIKLIKYEWNQIFIAYPSIKLLIENTNEPLTINSIPKKLYNDFLSLINSTKYKEIDKSTNDEYMVLTFNAILKCCSIQIMYYWLNKLSELKKLNIENFGICSLTMMTPLEWKEYHCNLSRTKHIYYTNKHAKRVTIVDKDLPIKILKNILFKKNLINETINNHEYYSSESGHETYDQPIGEINDNKLYAVPTHPRDYSQICIGLHAMSIIQSDLININASDPVYNNLQYFFEDLFIEFKTQFEPHQIEKIISWLFKLSMGKNDYKLWSKLISHTMKTCDNHHFDTVSWEPVLCMDIFDSIVYYIAQINSRDVIETFIAAMTSNVPLNNGLTILKQHIDAVGLESFGIDYRRPTSGTLSEKQLKLFALDLFKEKFEDTIDDLVMEIRWDDFSISQL